jgi:hypothetical protein
VQLKDYLKTIKDVQKREYREVSFVFDIATVMSAQMVFQRQQVEVSRIRDLLQYQEMLNLLGKEPVKQAFTNGTDGAVVQSFSLCSLFSL